jgi:hypothetical protein
MVIKQFQHYQLRTLLSIIIYCSSGFAYADDDSTNITPPNTTPYHQVIKSITTLNGSAVFTSSNQTIYSSSNLDAQSCPSNATLAYTGPITTYTVSVVYYATHFHYECATTAFGCGAGTEGSDPSASQLSGQSTTQPSTVCASSNYNSGCQHSESYSCHYNFCSNTSGTWYPVYTYTPDSNGTYTGGPAVCIAQGWAGGPVD